MSQPRIVLHHLRASRGSRIFWVLEELELPYDVVVHYMPKGSTHASTLKEVTPLSKSPALLLNDQLIYESGAIITELLAKFPSPNVESTSSSSSTFWGYFSEGSVMLFFQPARFLNIGRSQIKRSLTPEQAKGADALQNWMDDWSAGHMKMAMDEVEKYLRDKEWFSSSDKIGLGDFMMLTPVMALMGTKYPLGPNTQDWLKRVRARPAFKRALARIKKEESEQMKKGKL